MYENDVLFSLAVIVVTILASYLFKTTEKMGKWIWRQISLAKFRTF